MYHQHRRMAPSSNGGNVRVASHSIRWAGADEASGRQRLGARRANAANFGLAAGVWTGDISNAYKVIDSRQAGTVWVDTYKVLDPGAPFAGYM